MGTNRKSESHSVLVDPQVLIQNVAMKRPVAVIARVTLERLFDADALDCVFHQRAEQQYERVLLFSELLHILTKVILKQERSLSIAYKHAAAGDEINVSRTAFYDKLNRTEVAISEGLLHYNTAQAKAVIDMMNKAYPRSRRPSLLPGSGYRIHMIDGHHPAATDHRLEPLREQAEAPMPGRTVVVYDPRRDLIEEVFLERDGLASEVALVDWRGRLSQMSGKQDLWIADRGFCDRNLLRAVVSQGSAVLVRQKMTFQGTPLNEPVSAGSCSSGEVFEQSVKLWLSDAPVGKRYSGPGVGPGQWVTMRRITIKLKTPTRHRDKELHLFTNVPADKADAIALAELYRSRWQIETAFFEIDRTLNGELPELGHPESALLAMSLSLCLYNAMSVIKTAVAAAHGHKRVDEELSAYYMAIEISQMAEGLETLIEETAWQEYREQPAEDFVEQIVEWAGVMNWDRYSKTQRAKKPPGQSHRRRKTRPASVKKSTARALAEANNKSSP